MKIVIISVWFSENMGYAENFLPIAFGKLGHEVHLVTTDLQVYATSPEYEKVYQRYLGPKQVEQGIFKKEYYTLHRNSHSFTWRGGLKILNLEDKIRKIQPDIVYCFEIFNSDTLLACFLKSKYGYKLFCESRMHLSVFMSPKTFFQRIKQCGIGFVGRIMSLKIDQFYPIAPDVFKVITKYCGIPKRKCSISSLAVDADLFYSGIQTEETNEFRKKNGYDESDIVCLYTGRFTESKGPLILAQAINYLQETGYLKFKGLFVGQGDMKYENLIKNSKGCSIHPFVNVRELPRFYRSFDIGVWPLQESTSQLDAAACGMPIIINEKVEDNLRTQDNGLRYREGDFKDLAAKILMLEDKFKRREMGKIGSEKIAKFYSWDYLAKNKIFDFNRNLN